MTDLTAEQEFALIQETETSIFLIHEGLLALNSLSGANDFYQGPLLLLAQGFERLMKLTICLVRLEEEGSLPSLEEVKGYRHNLVVLADAVVDLSKRSGYADSRPVAREDTAFAAEDQQLRALLSALTAFGAGGRYYDLDALLDPTGHTVQRDDPVQSFQRVEAHILARHPEWESKLGTGEFDGFYEVLRSELTATLQHLARGLCRMFTFGPLGKRGQRLQGVVKTFLFLRDEDLDTVPARWFER